MHFKPKQAKRKEDAIAETQREIEEAAKEKERIEEELDKEIETLKADEKKADRRKKKIALKEKRKTAQRIDMKMIIPGNY